MNCVVLYVGISGVNGSIINVNMDKMKEIIVVNLYGMVYGIKYAVRVMIEGRRGGFIICISSSVVFMGGLVSYVYIIFKEGIFGLMRNVFCELGVYGIRVNCVFLYGVFSEMFISVYREFFGIIGVDEVSKIILEKASLLRGRGGRFEDVVVGVFFLVSDEVGFVIGYNFVIDGGYIVVIISLSYMF